MCTAPQVQVVGSEPSVLASDATVVTKAARITCCAVRRGPPGGLKAGLPGSFSVHVSRSSSRLAWPGPTASPPASRCTGTFAAFHQGWNTADR